MPVFWAEEVASDALTTTKKESPGRTTLELRIGEIDAVIVGVLLSTMIVLVAVAVCPLSSVSTTEIAFVPADRPTTTLKVSFAVRFEDFDLSRLLT